MKICFSDATYRFLHVIQPTTTSPTSALPTTAEPTMVVTFDTNEVCIWGRLGGQINSLLNGIYHYGGIINSAPYYVNTVSGTCGVTSYLYKYVDEWRIGPTLGGGAFSARCYSQFSADIADCIGNWEIYGGQGWEQDTNVFVTMDECPEWNCNGLSVSGSTQSPCNGNFDPVSGKQNAYKKQGKDVWIYFVPFLYGWVCDTDLQEATCPASYLVSADGWEDLNPSDPILAKGDIGNIDCLSSPATNDPTTANPTTSLPTTASPTTSEPTPTINRGDQCGPDCSVCDGFPLSCSDANPRCEFDPDTMSCNLVGCGTLCDQCDGNQTACLDDSQFCQWVPNPFMPSTNNGICAPINTCRANCALCDNTECTSDGAGGFGACQVIGPTGCEGVTCDTNCDECTGDRTACETSLAPPNGCVVNAGFCVPDTSNTIDTTSAAPTTADPTSANPTSSEPTSAQPTTYEPTITTIADQTLCGPDCSVCNGFPLSCLDAEPRCEFDPVAMVCNLAGSSPNTQEPIISTLSMDSTESEFTSTDETSLSSTSDATTSTIDPETTVAIGTGTTMEVTASPTNEPSMEPTMNDGLPSSTEIISQTMNVSTTAKFDDEQCIVSDIVFEVFFSFDRIKRKCDICLYEEYKRRRQDRRCEIIEDLIDGFVNDYGECMLNVCDYNCTVGTLQLNPKFTAGEEECRRGCNMFECGPQAANAYRYSINGLMIVLMIAFAVTFI